MRIYPWTQGVGMEQEPEFHSANRITAGEWHEIAVKNALLTAEALAHGEHESAADFNARCRHANRMVLHLRSEPQRRFTIRPRDLPYRRSRVE